MTGLQATELGVMDSWDSCNGVGIAWRFCSFVIGKLRLGLVKSMCYIIC